MKQSRNSEAQQKQTLLNSKERQYPQLFKWKVAALIILILVIGFSVADIVIAVYLNNHQPRNINYTFAVDIISNLAQIQPTTPLSQLVNMLTGFSVSYSKLWYQQSQLLRSWSASSNDAPLNIDAVASIFDSNTDQLLILVGFSDVNNNPHLGATYTHISFKVPQSDYSSYLQNNKSYYTFEIQNRQSVLLGVAQPNYLKMDGSTSNLLDCKIINLNQTTLTLMGSLNIDFAKSNVIMGNLIADQTWDCFEGIVSEQNFSESFNSIMGIQQQAQPYNLKWLKVFHLST